MYQERRLKNGVVAGRVIQEMRKGASLADDGAGKATSTAPAAAKPWQDRPVRTHLCNHHASCHGVQAACTWAAQLVRRQGMARGLDPCRMGRSPKCSK